MNGSGIVHRPVLAEEVVTHLAPPEGPALMIDGTLGEGGHTALMLERFPDLKVIGLDRDPAIQAVARRRLATFGDRFAARLTWFDEYFARYPEKERPDRILLDLGISVFHYEKSGRGFAFRADEPLDMRLEAAEGDSAADIVNSLPEAGLADLIYRFGEERYSRRIARAVAEARTERFIETARDLAEIVFNAVPVSYRHGRIHPATRTFQALRIAVNHELDRLDSALEEAFHVLKVDGIMGIITFHSLEDRRVKNAFRNWARACICPPEKPVCVCGGKPLGILDIRKPVTPGDEEVAENSPSRSAKLRVIRKVAEDRGGA